MVSVGVIKDKKICFAPAINEERRRYVERLKDGTVIEETLCVPRKDKSQNQLGAHFGLMIANIIAEFDYRGYDTSFLLNTPNPTGNQITTDLLKEYFYNVCPIFNETGQRITIRKANTAEMAKHFDDCRNFAASQWSIYIPEPDRNWRENNGQ